MKAAALCLLIAFAACGGDDDDDDGIEIDAAASGRACASGAEPGDPTLLASPALDCPSGLCLHVQDQASDLCTDFCDDASDCLNAEASMCDGEFACVAPVDQGPFACRKVCVCAGAVPEGGFPVDCR